MTAFGSRSNISLVQNTLQLNLPFTEPTKSILYCVANNWWHPEKKRKTKKTTGAGQEHLMQGLLCFLKTRCLLPSFNLSYNNQISENPDSSQTLLLNHFSALALSTWKFTPTLSKDSSYADKKLAVLVLEGFAQTAVPKTTSRMAGREPHSDTCMPDTLMMEIQMKGGRVTTASPVQFPAAEPSITLCPTSLLTTIPHKAQQKSGPCYCWH